MKSPGKYQPNKSGAKSFTKKSVYKTKEWSEYRLEFLTHNPKCYCCGQPARVVDHWRAHKGDTALFEDPENMIPMCKSCHSTVTQLYDKGPVADVQGKLKWIELKRQETETFTRVKVVSWTA